MADTLLTIAPFIVSLLGVFVGYRLNIGRDKRKEYLDAVIPFKQKLLHCREHFLHEEIVPINITHQDKHRLQASQPKTFNKISGLLYNYQQEIENISIVKKGGLIVYKEESKKRIIEIIDKILKELKV